MVTVAAKTLNLKSADYVVGVSFSVIILIYILQQKRDQRDTGIRFFISTFSKRFFDGWQKRVRQHYVHIFSPYFCKSKKSNVLTCSNTRFFKVVVLQTILGLFFRVIPEIFFREAFCIRPTILTYFFGCLYNFLVLCYSHLFLWLV